MASIIKHTRILKPLLENNSISLVSKLKYATTFKSKLVDGPNGEKIITFDGDRLTYPEMPLHEYVWKNVNKYPNKVVLECAITGKKYTMAEARDASNYLARSLQKLGLKKDDVMAVILPNLPEYAIAFLGSLEAGLVVTTVNPIYTPDEIGRQLKNSNVKAIITSDDIVSTVQEAMKAALPPQSPLIVIKNDSTVPDGCIHFQELITKGKSLPAVETRFASCDDIAALPYSSGTTGLPKGVMLTHRNCISNMEMAKQTSSDFLIREATDTFQDVIPAILPMYHSYGLNAVLLPRIAVGAKLVTLPRFSPDDYIQLLIKYKATVLSIVPPIMLFLTAAPFIKKSFFDSLSFILSGAAPLAASDVMKFYTKYGIDSDQVKYVQGYGLTETSPISTIEMDNKYDSIGKPIKGCSIRIVDTVTNKDAQQPMERGEIWIRGPHVMKGYLNNEKATKETMESDWLKTGDMGYYDKEYSIYITDRIKELIKVKGLQVAPAELEGLLRSHPDILEAAVIGIPDTRCGEVPKAFIIKKDESNLTEEDVHKFLKGKISEFKELKGGVNFVDYIPKSPTGKILRTHLKQEYMSQS